MAFDAIRYDEREGYAEITLDRPDSLNAVNDRLRRDLYAALERAHEDPGVYAVVLTGGGRAFCSGGDLAEMEDRDPTDSLGYAAHLWETQMVVRMLYLGPTPTVAAVNGPAVGAGCDLALACDLRVMADDAWLTEGFVNVGLVPGDGGGWLLPRLVGEAKAREYLLTGREITADAAEGMGLVAEVVEDGVAEAARELAIEIRDTPRLAVERTKALLAERTFEEYLRAALEYQVECANDPEHREAVSAFVEGRDPEFDR